MTAQLLSSKIVIQEEPPSLRTIQGVATGVTACVGVTARGPIGVPVLCTSWETFARIFGTDIAASFSASAVRGFFDNGGERLYFTRVVHYTDVANPNSKTSTPGTFNLLTSIAAPTAAQLTGSIVGPYALVNGDTLKITRDAAGLATATFTATAAFIDSTGNDPYTLANAQTLAVRINGGTTQTVVFHTADFVDITAATDAEIAPLLQAALTGATVTVIGAGGVKITSNRKGSSSRVEIVGGTAAAALGFAVSIASGTGNVADAAAVTVAEIKTIVEQAVSGVTVVASAGAVRITGTVEGVGGVVQVDPSSTADDELGLDNAVHNGTSGDAQPTLRVDSKYDGVYSTQIRVLLLPSSSGIASEFNMAVTYSGVTVEQWPNLTMLNTSVRHVEAIVNADVGGSRYIRVTDLNLSPGSGGAGAERPADSLGSPRIAYGPLTGGTDGDAITEHDFIGDSAGRTGFYSFDLINDAELLICPDAATPAVHNAALAYVSINRNGEMFFIADPPAAMGPTQINDYAIVNLKETTEHAAFYWPRVKVLNPSPALYGSATTIIVPPSGHIAGMFARNDGARIGGVYQPPGGVERGQLAGVLGVENEEVNDERIRDLIVPNLINPICQHRGQPLAVDDVLTLLTSGPFPTVAERRGVTFIERSIKDGIQYARLRNNDEDLRANLYKTIDAFLLIQMRSGAFRSKDPSTAFFIDTSEALNPPTEQFAGRVNARIGLATQKPGRFIILKFSQDTRALDQELAAS